MPICYQYVHVLSLSFEAHVCHDAETNSPAVGRKLARKCHVGRPWSAANSGDGQGGTNVHGMQRAPRQDPQHAEETTTRLKSNRRSPAMMNACGAAVASMCLSLRSGSVSPGCGKTQYRKHLHKLPHPKSAFPPRPNDIICDHGLAPCAFARVKMVQIALEPWAARLSTCPLPELIMSSGDGEVGDKQRHNVFVRVSTSLTKT